MATIAEVRTAIATAVDGITNLRCVAYVTDQVAGNQAQVVRGSIDYDIVMGRGADEWQWQVVVYAPRSEPRSSQIFLDTLCEPSGATSLKTVVEYGTSPTLGGIVDYVQVKSASAVQVVTVGAVEYLAVTFDLEVCY